MLRVSIFASLIAATIVPACTDEAVEDELAGESSQDGEEGKGDAAAAFTFFSVSPDVRACSLDSRCGGFFVSRPNRSTTNCGRFVNGTSERCYVDSLDFSGTAMPDSVALSYEKRIRMGESMILRGDIAPDPADRGSSLRVTQVWVGGSDTGSDDGVAVLVKTNDIRCVVAPCPSLDELRLNSNRFARITDLDLDDTGARGEAILNAHEALYSDGVIVFGDRYYPSRGKGRRAHQFYTRAPVPLH